MLLRAEKKGDGYYFYRLFGFPLALQIWFYECCDYFDGEFDVNEDSSISHLLNWCDFVILNFKKFNLQIMNLSSS